MSQSVFFLKRTYIMMRKQLDVRLSEYNLTTSQLEVLGYLYKIPHGLEQVQLQQYSGITSATLTGILDKMEKRQYISREISHSDGRIKVVVLTEHGFQIFARLIDLMEQFENDMLNGFSKAERALLADWLQRIAKNMGDDWIYGSE
ncbi:MarR family transcriptional regulator [Paenibacillus sp. GSMTC-2017]|uniref:MarR family winged helix-turn-helix transcriptional regulator n=1 Tax=Paenibacillus sp. GSMTC-2017 TaxID=2794350 RepID=UPI0018D9D1FF|nr:MarR family transcriptional regulator [Paenibacillus sp. GSMTC-2017]MBH5316236.1 MarR family transcriptional regulator [Paenibacillus sp. GSMTC-2017]